MAGCIHRSRTRETRYYINGTANSGFRKNEPQHVAFQQKCQCTMTFERLETNRGLWRRREFTLPCSRRNGSLNALWKKMIFQGPRGNLFPFYYARRCAREEKLSHKYCDVVGEKPVVENRWKLNANSRWLICEGLFLFIFLKFVLRNNRKKRKIVVSSVLV